MISVEGDMSLFFFTFRVMNSSGVIVIESCYEFSELVEVFCFIIFCRSFNYLLTIRTNSSFLPNRLIIYFLESPIIMVY